jgi:hypothetical protein
MGWTSAATARPHIELTDETGENTAQLPSIPAPPIAGWRINR